MRKLIKLQLRQYRGAEMQVLLGMLVIMTFVGWISHALFHAPADLVLMIFRIGIWIFIGAATIIQYLSYIQVGSGDDYTLPLHIPMPQLWSLAARQLASLPIAAAAAAAYLLLGYAFRSEPYVYLPTGWQWLLSASYYLLGVSIAINMLTVRRLLKYKLALPRRLQALRKASRWCSATDSVADVILLILPVAYVIAITRLAAISGEWVASRPLMALIICAGSAAITCLNAYLIECYGPQLDSAI